jgi:hypothetical protein
MTTGELVFFTAGIVIGALVAEWKAISAWFKDQMQ